MAAGKPVVASRTGGLGEIVSHGETGMLVPRGDPDQLAEAIRQIWYQPDLCESLGRAGRQRLERNYSRQRHYDRLISIYARAIALGPGGVGRNRTRTPTTRQEAVDAA
jgi:glycosyltransferase involved in cell wall biosynthesis